MKNPINPKDFMKNISFFLAFTLFLSSSFLLSMDNLTISRITPKRKKHVYQLINAILLRENQGEIEKALKQCVEYEQMCQRPQDKSFQQSLISLLLVKKSEIESASAAAVVNQEPIEILAQEAQADFAAAAITNQEPIEILEQNAEIVCADLYESEEIDNPAVPQKSGWCLIS